MTAAPRQTHATAAPLPRLTLPALPSVAEQVV